VYPAQNQKQPRGGGGGKLQGHQGGRRSGGLQRPALSSAGAIVATSKKDTVRDPGQADAGLCCGALCMCWGPAY
jgi:hypothetical protein